MTPKPAYIVRSAREAEWVRRSAEPALFLCTNARTLEECRRHPGRALILDEEMIQREFSAINLWAVRRTLAFIAKFAEGGKARDFLESNYMYVNALFAQTLMTFLVLREVKKREGFDRLCVFDGGRSFLGLALRVYARISPQSWALTVLPEIQSVSRKPALSRLKNACFAGLSTAMARKRMESASKAGRKILLASGALNHLSALVSEVRARGGHEIVYVENEFNLEKFKHCLREGMSLFVLPEPAAPFNPLEAGRRYFEAGEISFAGTDHSAFFEAFFAEGFQNGIFFDGRPLDLSFDYEKTLALFSEYDFDAAVLDEDWLMRRLFSVLSARAGKKCFVVSHGIPGILLDERDASLRGRYFSSPTFVNADFEKEQYEGLFFDPGRLLTTGIPRYDAVAALKSEPSAPRASKTVLYCGGGMQDYDFEFVKPSLGLKNAQGEYTRRYTRDILDICAGREGVSLDIKPHYDQRPAWEECLAAGKAGNIRLLSHREDTFRLEKEADLVISIESTVVCEAILFEKPVIVLNYTSHGLLADYERHGLVEQARNKEELRAAVEKCLYDDNYLRELAKRRSQYLAHYAGAMDGQNTRRAAERVLEPAREPAHV